MQAFAIEAFESLVEWLVWPALLHSLWFGLLTASVVALVFQACTRLSHHARYGILLAALFLTILGPAVATFFVHAIASRPGQNGEPEPAIATVLSAENPSPEAQMAPLASVIPNRPKSASRGRFAAFFVGSLASLAETVRQLRLFIVSAWLFGVVLSGGILALGTRALQRLMREAEPASQQIQERARALGRHLRMKQAPSVLVHPAIDEPCLTGLFQPAILLPARWLASSRGDLLDSILAHELAHARRLDHVVNLAQRLVETILFFHPAVHWLSRSLRRHREFCTDQLALRVTHDRLALARALESVALLRMSYPAARLACPSLGGQSTSLLPRIEELIGMKPVCPRPHVWPFAALPAAGLIVLVAASAVLAKDRPSASATQAGTKPGLAIRQEHLAPNDSSFRPIAVRPPTSREMDRMITFEVKIISLDAEPWRDLLKDRMKLMKQEADVCAWMIDAKALTDLLNLAQADATSNVLQAPRVTALENATATIVNEHKQYFVAQMERTGDLEKVAFHPIVVAIDIGMRMNLIGKLQPEGIQLSVDLQDSDILAMHTLHRKERLGEKIFAASYQVPTRVYKCCRVTYNVPENSSLVISLGLRDRQAKSSNAAAAASELLELVGLPPVPARSVTCERLVVITPRRLSLEADNRPKARTPTVAAKPGVR